LGQTYHRLRNHFGHIRWNSKVTQVKWKLVVVSLEMVLIMTQDRFTVCSEHAIGLEIISGAPDVLGDMG
jgi:hypothetical protein